MDERVVELRPTSFGLPMDYEKGRCPIFDSPKPESGRIPFLNEGPLDVAAAGRLALDLGWPRARLGFRSSRDHFDVSAYAAEAGQGTERRLLIAAESKWRQPEVEELAEDIAMCGSRGEHEYPGCVRKKNHHNKYRGLLRLRPELLWLIGPDRRRVFRVEYRGDKELAVHEESENALRCRP